MSTRTGCGRLGMGNKNAPCKGCPDRYLGCADHCRKAEYLQWRQELERIRENRRKYVTPIWKREQGRAR